MEIVNVDVEDIMQKKLGETEKSPTTCSISSITITTYNSNSQWIDDQQTIDETLNTIYTIDIVLSGLYTSNILKITSEEVEK